MIYLKDVIRNLCPPILWNALKRLTTQQEVPGFYGSYPSFQEALLVAGEGYDTDEIARKTVNGSISISSAPSDYIGFKHLEMLGAFLCLGLATKENLNVCDFGGGGGSYYFAMRKALPIVNLSWFIVELPQLSVLASQELASKELQFLTSFNQLQTTPDVVVASSAIQYCPDPYSTVRDIIDANPDAIVIDRIPLLKQGERVAIQTVPPSIYSAKYPVWLMNEEKFLSSITADYKLIRRFSGPESIQYDGREIPYQGFLLKKL